MNSPLLPHFFHKCRFHLTVFCCFHIVSGSLTDRLSNVCHILIGYKNGKLLNDCFLFVSEDSFNQPPEALQYPIQQPMFSAGLCCSSHTDLVSSNYSSHTDLVSSNYSSHTDLVSSNQWLHRIITVHTHTIRNEHKKYKFCKENISNSCSSNKQLQSQNTPLEPCWFT